MHYIDAGFAVVSRSCTVRGGCSSGGYTRLKKRRSHELLKHDAFRTTRDFGCIPKVLQVCT